MTGLAGRMARAGDVIEAWLGAALASPNILGQSVEALGRYKLRTALSTLGVVLGVAAVTSMLSVSEGARREALRDVTALGLDNLCVRERGLDIGDLLRRLHRPLEYGDRERLARTVPGVRRTAAVAVRTLRVASDQTSRSVVVLGVDADYALITRLTLDRGRWFSSDEDRTAERTAVLGRKLALDLFGPMPAIAQFVKIGQDYYRVVGTAADGRREDGSTTTAIAWPLDDSAVIPLSALVGHRLDRDPGQRVDEVWVQVADVDRVSSTASVVEATLVGSRGGARNFDIVIPQALLHQRVKVQRTFNIVVGSIALISLLVGGIGIMNIMLASVLERTTEIGLRRAVGARRRHVLVQFLVESSVMTAAGGILGVGVGGLGAILISRLAAWPVYVSMPAVVLGFTVSVIVGVAFGSYPALRASRLSPIEALHRE